jgi:uncharacterized iron-regulated membrane protein
MSSKNMHQTMRIYHRYLGFFLAGIMAVYALSGIVLIFRDTNFLKHTKQVEKQLKPNLTVELLGKELKIKELKADKEDSATITFKQGIYSKTSGIANYSTKELPYFVQKLTNLHKASTKNPLFFLNVFFGISLLFFVISSFWMFMPKTTIFKKGLYFTLAGIVLTIILLVI